MRCCIVVAVVVVAGFVRILIANYIS